MSKFTQNFVPLQQSMWQQLPARGQEIVFYFCQCMKHDKLDLDPTVIEVVVDTSQRLCRNSPKNSLVNCLCRKSKPWLLMQMRRFFSIEHLAFQGIFEDDFPGVRSASDVLLKDLAGNAFNAAACAAVIVTFLCSLGAPRLPAKRRRLRDKTNV